ncbi:MAG: phosphopantetheine-binding protein [Kiritimatiellia bacterium]
MNDVLLTVFRETLRLPTLELVLSDSSDTIEAWDSLAHLALLLALERRFHVTFTSSEMVSMRTVADILAMLKVKGALPSC